MLKLAPFCDFCNQPMQEDEDNNVLIFRTKEIDTRKLFPHLCKNCADKLDKTMLLCKKKWIDDGDKIAQIAKRNAERRELLGTKG